MNVFERRAGAITALRATRELLTDANRWTQHAYARSKSGAAVDYNSRSASCWCLEGALAKAATHPFYGSARELLIADIPYNSIQIFNDRPGTTHADVLAAIDHAIAKAEAQP